jgi:uncharacterized membrane protein YgdD (TMEM256/DUF423 family)
MLNQRSTLIAASFCGILAVGLGAFGAHALKDLLTANNRLDTYELATRYHFYHTLALMALAILMDKFPGNLIKTGTTLMFVGMILFSGSLYALSLSNITKIAIITPFGGVFMIAGWVAILISFFRSKH